MQILLPRCPIGSDEHLFGLRGPAAPPPGNETAREARRRHTLADLAMTEEEWARRYAESAG